MNGGEPKEEGIAVNVPALETYTTNLSYYTSEADKFGGLMDQSDVTNESWGLIGLAVKDQYTSKLAELRDLLATMKEGVETFSDKLGDAAAIYKGLEDDAAMTFGQHETTVDGPLP